MTDGNSEVVEDGAPTGVLNVTAFVRINSLSKRNGVFEPASAILRMGEVGNYLTAPYNQWVAISGGSDVSYGVSIIADPNAVWPNGGIKHFQVQCSNPTIGYPSIYCGYSGVRRLEEGETHSKVVGNDADLSNLYNMTVYRAADTDTKNLYFSMDQVLTEGDLEVADVFGEEVK